MFKIRILMPLQHTNAVCDSLKAILRASDCKFDHCGGLKGSVEPYYDAGEGRIVLHTCTGFNLYIYFWLGLRTQTSIGKTPSRVV